MARTRRDGPSVGGISGACRGSGVPYIWLLLGRGGSPSCVHLSYKGRLGIFNVGFAMKRSPLRPVSKHRQKVNRERRRLQEAEWGPRPWPCLFSRFHDEAVAGGALEHSVSLHDFACRGEVWGHELLKRSRAGSTDENLLNIEGQVPLCNFHNEWVESHPIEANRIGLADHARK
jgi:hypothetical protein